eukprot:scaffold262947_cov24-Tisochrysis_lutea.AAC.2
MRSREGASACEMPHVDAAVSKASGPLSAPKQPGGGVMSAPTSTAEPTVTDMHAPDRPELSTLEGSVSTLHDPGSMLATSVMHRCSKLDKPGPSVFVRARARLAPFARARCSSPCTFRRCGESAPAEDSLSLACNNSSPASSSASSLRRAAEVESHLAKSWRTDSISASVQPSSVASLPPIARAGDACLPQLFW